MEAKNPKKSISKDRAAGVAIKNTNRGVDEVIVHNAHSARRDLSDARVTVAKLFEQESVVAKHVGGIFRTCERRDRVSLRIIIVVVRLKEDMVLGSGIVRAIFPMTRTGVLSFVGLYGGSLSTERTGHLNAV